MSDRWFKLDTDFGTNAKIDEACELAGREAVLLFFGLLGLYSKFGMHGVIPETRARPRQLRLSMTSVRLSTDEIEGGLDALQKSELVAREADGAIRICGMDDTWAPRCGKCKSANLEPAVSGYCPNCRGKRAKKKLADSDVSDDRDTTARRPSPTRTTAARRPQDKTGTDERGIDQEQSPVGLVNSSLLDPDLVDFLARVGWGNNTAERRRKAKSLASEGATVRDLDLVWQYCNEKGEDPIRLFAHHLKQPSGWKGIRDDLRPPEEPGAGVILPLNDLRAGKR